MAANATAMLAVSALVVTVLPVLFPSDRGTGELVVHWIGAAVLAGAAATCRLLDPEVLDRWHFGLVLNLSSVAVLGALHLRAGDVSGGVRAFYALPVLWSAVHLRSPAVVLVTGSALTMDVVILMVLRPAPEVLVDFLPFGSLLAAIAALLVRAGHTQERLVRALQEQARVDALTGLVNRRAFDDALSIILARPVRAGTALVLIDVDAFKTINDAHGHPAGDAALVHLAGVLREQVRVADAVLSRLGGDELAVLLPGCSADAAARRAEELLTAVRAAPLRLADGTLLALSVSVGVAHVPERSGDLQALYHAADTALYDAKRSGRGRVAVASA